MEMSMGMGMGMGQGGMGLILRDEIKENLKKGVIKKERRRSHDNFVLTVDGKKNQKPLENIAKMSQGNQLTKISLRAAPPEQEYPYILEDFGVL
jgi:hypothetical protein